MKRIIGSLGAVLSNLLLWLKSWFVGRKADVISEVKAVAKEIVRESTRDATSGMATSVLRGVGESAKEAVTGLVRDDKELVGASARADTRATIVRESSEKESASESELKEELNDLKGSIAKAQGRIDSAHGAPLPRSIPLDERLRKIGFNVKEFGEE